MRAFFNLPPVWWPPALLPFDNDVVNRVVFLVEVLLPVLALCALWCA